jgi:hypothetical protein
MKKLFLGIVAALVLPLLCAAQTAQDDDLVPVIAYWHPGDELVLDFATKQTQIDPDGTEQALGFSSHTITLKVLEETDKSYLVRVSYSNVSSSASEDDIVMALSSAIAENLSYEILTDQFGSVQELAHLDETLQAMRDKVPALVDGVLAKYDKAAIKAQAVDRDDIVKRFTGLFDGPGFIAQDYNQYLHPLFLFHGHRYRLDHEYTTEQTFYKVLNLGSLDLEMGYLIDPEHCNKDYVSFSMLAEADKEQMKPFAEALDAADEADLTMEEGAALTIDRATGWPNDYYKERTISIIDKESGEVMKIVWVLGAADRRNLSKAD